MSYFKPSFLLPALLSALVTTGCASKRQIVVDYPAATSNTLTPIIGLDSVSADDYYLQLISEFEFKGDNVLKAGCSDMSSGYESGDLSAAVVFKVANDTLHFQQDITGFVYKASSGKCNFNLETKKASLTPWLRLDLAKDTLVNYHFFTSNSSDTHFSKLVSDVNSTTNLLALTGVGTGVAIMGQLANEWVQKSQATQSPVVTPAAAKYSSETHTLPAAIQFTAQTVTLNPARLAVYEVIEGGMGFSDPEPKLLGELKVTPELAPSLLLKLSPTGVPSAQDLSLAELWRKPIHTGNGNKELGQFLEAVEHIDKPNLQPNWRQYSEVESNCRKLKLVLKELGFNRFDRNAVLYYFLDNSRDWKNYNISNELASAYDVRPVMLRQYRSKDFSGCLAREDYESMVLMGLPVNTPQHWAQLQASRQKKENIYSPAQSIGRQLVAVLKNSNPTEMTRQIYPLLATMKEGNGHVLLQNHLGDFGLEDILALESLSGEGRVIKAEQVEQVFAWLAVDQLSCARPVFQQNKTLRDIGIVLFTTREGSPWPKGGALEYQVVNGKVARMTFQHPSFRDFEQSLQEIPEIGGCRIEQELLNKLH